MKNPERFNKKTGTLVPVFSPFFATEDVLKVVSAIVFVAGCLLLATCNEDTVEPVFFGSINGRVTLEANGQPAIGVEVTTVPPTSVVFTDSTGNFLFSEVATGKYSVVTKFEGYEGVNKSIEVTKGIPTQVDIKLARDQSAPAKPDSPVPQNMQNNVARNISLRWGIKNESNDELTFDLTVYESNQNNPIVQEKGLTDSTYTLSELKFNTSYFWQVISYNSSSLSTFGELWSFKTIPFPDNRFAFSTSRDGNFEIYSSNDTGSDMVRLTFSSTAEVNPQFSNNRNLIAFAANTNLEFQLFTMKKDGSAVTQVTSIPIAGYHNNGKGFCWSPDNGKLVYSHYDKLYTIERNGTNLTLLTTAPPGRHFRGCDWTGVTNQLVVETVGVLPFDSEIRLIDLAAPADSVLINNQKGTTQGAVFSIDGKSILYTHDVSGFEVTGGRQLNSHMFLYNLETKVVTDLSVDKPDGTNDLNPRFSPDGSKVIFENRANDNSGKPSVWILSLSDDTRTKLFDNAIMPCWK